MYIDRIKPMKKIIILDIKLDKKPIITVTKLPAELIEVSIRLLVSISLIYCSKLGYKSLNLFAISLTQVKSLGIV